MDAYQQSFEELKDRLTSAPVLALPNGRDGFVVYSDASRQGLGCVLMQNDRVIAYTQEISNLWKNGKIIISIKIRNLLSRSRMMKRISPLESSCEI